MALERFIPKSPDANIRNTQDFEVAKFGHLNTIVEYINNNSAKPAGLNGYVQFNDNNALGGSPNLVWNNSTNSLTLGSGTTSAFIDFASNPIGSTTNVGAIRTYQDGTNLLPTLQFIESGDIYQNKYSGIINNFFFQDNAGVNMPNGTGVYQGDYVGRRNGSTSTLFRNAVTYNGDGTTRRGRYSMAVAESSGFGSYQLVLTQYGNLKINISGHGAGNYIDDAISPTTAYNIHAGNIINTIGSTLPLLSLDVDGLTKHVFQTNGNVSFNNIADMAAVVGIKGSGATSATTSLLVQNSAGSLAFYVRDDAYVFGASRVYSTGNMYMDGSTGLLFSAWGQLQLQGASYVQINNDTLRVGSQNFNFLNLSFSPNNNTNSNLRLVGNGSSFTNGGAGGTSVGNVLEIPIGIDTSIGNVTLNHIHINGVVNTTGGTTLQRGFYYNPTLTGTVGFTHNAIETVTGNVLLGTTSGNVGIGSTNPAFPLVIARNGGQLRIISTGDSSSAIGIGNDNSNSRLFLSGGESGNGSIATIEANGGVRMRMRGSYLTIANSSVDPNNTPSLFGIRGVGSTSATTSLLVQNSTPATMFSVDDAGNASANLTLSAPIVSGTTAVSAGPNAYAGGALRVGISGGGALATFQYGTTAGGAYLQFIRNGASAGGITSSAFETYDLALGAGNFGSTLGIVIRPANIGGVKIGGSNSTVVHVDSAILNVESTTKGFLPPRMTTAERTAIASPAAGLVVFDTTLQNLCYYRDGVWVQATFTAA